jgi:hypothetical protein
MLLFKRLLTSCILFMLLSLAVLISMGVVVGTHGGIHSPAVSDYDSSYSAGGCTRNHEKIRPGRFSQHVEHVGVGCSCNFVQWNSSMVPEAISSAAGAEVIDCDTVTNAFDLLLFTIRDANQRVIST